jgi:hypothetical protein
MKCRICNKEEESSFMSKLGICEECYFSGRDIPYEPTPQDIKEGETMAEVALGKRQSPLRWLVNQFNKNEEVVE